MVSLFNRQEFLRLSEHIRDKFPEDAVNVLNRIHLFIHFSLLKLSLVMFFYPHSGTMFYAEGFSCLFWAYIIMMIYSMLMVVSMVLLNRLFYTVNMVIYVLVKSVAVSFVIFKFFFVFFTQYDGSLTKLMFSTIGVSSVSASVAVIVTAISACSTLIRLSNMVVLSGLYTILKEKQKKEQEAANREGNQEAARLV